VWRAARTRSLREARAVLVVWALAAVVPAALTTPL